MKLQNLLSGCSVIEEEIAANVRQEGSHFDRASAEALIQQARQEWPVHFEEEEVAVGENAPLEACVSCYLRGRELSYQNMAEEEERSRERFRKKIEQIEAGYVSITKALRVVRCFENFLEELLEYGQAKTNEERMVIAGTFVNQLTDHYGELILICMDLLESGLVDLDEALLQYRSEQSREGIG